MNPTVKMFSLLIFLTYQNKKFYKLMFGISNLNRLKRGIVFSKKIPNEDLVTSMKSPYIHSSGDEIELVNKSINSFSKLSIELEEIASEKTIMNFIEAQKKASASLMNRREVNFGLIISF